MQANQTPTLVPLPFAANGTKNTIPEASQIGITPGAASLNDGFPPLTFTPVAAGGIPPAGADFNGILNLITQTIRWKHAGGQFGYSSAFANDTNVGGYPRGALLMRADLSGLWLNQADNNTTNPDTGGAGWSAAFMSGTVGQARNLAMSVTSASATATLTADEIVVSSSLGGQKYVLSSFSKSINLASTGAGGMDVGTSPVSAWVAIYLIYNPVTGASALLGYNTGGAVAPEVYSGGNMPAGFTASALVSVIVTNGSGLIKPLTQKNRKVVFPGIGIFNTSADNASFQPISLVGVVPPNAKTAGGYGDAAITAPGTINFAFASDSTGMGNQTFNSSCASAYGNSLVWTEIPLAVQQTIYIYRAATLNGSGTRQYNAYCSSYTF